MCRNPLVQTVRSTCLLDGATLVAARSSLGMDQCSVLLGSPDSSKSETRHRSCPSLDFHFQPASGTTSVHKSHICFDRMHRYARLVAGLVLAGFWAPKWTRALVRTQGGSGSHEVGCIKLAHTLISLDQWVPTQTDQPPHKKMDC